MSHQLPEGISIDSMIDYAVLVQAGLEAEGLDAFVKTWEGVEAELVTARTERDAARKKVIKASAKVRVQKVHWREALTGVSGRSYELASKKAKDAPHGPLFSAIPAAKAKKFGAERAVDFGKTVVSKGYAFAMPALDERLKPFHTENQKLETVATGHSTAETEAETHEIARGQLVSKVEKQIAQTEADILGKLPGRNDLVQAILSTYEVPKKKARKDEPTS